MKKTFLYVLLDGTKVELDLPLRFFERENETTYSILIDDQFTIENIIYSADKKAYIAVDSSFKKQIEYDEDKREEEFVLYDEEGRPTLEQTTTYAGSGLRIKTEITKTSYLKGEKLISKSIHTFKREPIEKEEPCQ